MLKDDVILYSELTGNDGLHTSIGIVGAYLDGYEKGKKEIVRCKDCKHKPSRNAAEHDIIFPDDKCPCQCEDYWYSWIPRDDWYCGNAERKEAMK